MSDLSGMFTQFTDPRLQRLFAALPAAEAIITTEIEELWADDWVRCRRTAAAVLLGDAAHAHDAEHRPGRRHGDGGRGGARRGTGERR